MGKITVSIADEDQSNLLDEVMNLKKKKKKKKAYKKREKKIFLKAYMHFWKIEKRFLMLSKVDISISTNCKHRKWFRHSFASKNINS